MVAPILLYGSEVRGIEDYPIIDHFNLKIYTFILKLKIAPYCMIQGKLLVTPISI